MSKKNAFNWGHSSSEEEEFHRVEWPWDEQDEDSEEPDESYGAEDYYSSRPWTDE